MLYSFNDGAAKSQRNAAQYFEMFGNRGIYQDGWMATTRHGRLPWGAGSPGGFDDDPWELYNIVEDFSQADNLAARHPEKVKALQAAFLVEAKKYNVLPLDDRLAERFDAALRPNPLAGLKRFTYGPGVSGISESAVLKTHGVSFSVTAQVEVGEAGSDAVVAAIATEFLGLRPLREGTAGPRSIRTSLRWTTPAPVERGPAQGHVHRPHGVDAGRAGPGKPADVKLFVNGKETGKGRVAKTVPFRYSVEPFDVGRDTVSR